MPNLRWSVFVLMLFSFTGHAQTGRAMDLSSLSAQERAALGDEIREYILQNPEVLVEAMQLLEQRQAASQALDDQTMIATHAKEIFDDGRSWVGGNPDGDISMVEFVDYRCGYCRKALEEVDQVIEDDNNLRLVIKEFPILGEESLQAARFAIATRRIAGADTYDRVHHALFALRGPMSEKAFKRIATKEGLDFDTIRAEMAKAEITDEITANRRLAQTLKISGTPSFVLGDEMLRGYLPARNMQEIIASIRAKRQ